MATAPEPGAASRERHPEHHVKGFLISEVGLK